MVATRVGSLSLTNATLRDVAATQTKLADLQNQISSGYKSTDFAGLNGNVEQFTQLNGQLDRAKQFQSNNLINISKLQTADVALGNLVDIADQIKTTIVGANGATIGTSNIKQVLTDLLTSFRTQLNTSFNGHYIFGGTDTNNEPMPDSTVPNTVKGVPDGNYYAGSQVTSTLRVDDRNDVPFPVRGDDVAFQKIYAAAQQAIAAATNGDTTQLLQSQQLIQSGQTDLIAARSRIGSTVDNIQSQNSRLTQLSTYWTQLADGVSKTDLVSASTQISGYQAILQASYQVYARLSQLRLSDYLK